MRYKWAYSYMWRQCQVWKQFGFKKPEQHSVALMLKKNLLKRLLILKPENLKILMFFKPFDDKIDISLWRNANVYCQVMRLPSKNQHGLCSPFEINLSNVPQIPRVCLFTKNQWNWNRQPLTGRHINRLPSYWSYKPSYHENHDSAPMKSQLLVGELTIFPNVFPKVFHQVPGPGHPAPAFVSRSSRWSTRPLPAVPCSSPPGAAWGGTAGVGCVGWDLLGIFFPSIF